MCLLDAGVELRDDEGQAAADVLVVVDARNAAPALQFLSSMLHAAYMAVVFTRHPSLVVPGQQHALLAVSLVQSIAQLADNPSTAHVINTLHILHTLRCYLFASRASKPHECPHHPHPTLGPLCGPARNAYDFACVSRLLSPQPGCLLTEADEEAQSMCRILATLCAVPELSRACNFFGQSNIDNRIEACLALLAESVSRDVRMKMRSEPTEGLTDQEHSMKLLQVRMTKR